MATLTVQQIKLSGTTLASAVGASASGDEFQNDGKTYLEVINGSGGAVVVTINGQRGLPLDTSATKTVTVGASATAHIGPFPTAYYNNQSGVVQVDYDDVATSSPTVRSISVADEDN